MTCEEDRWLTIEEAAVRLHVRPGQVLHLVRHGGLGEQRDGVWLANAEAVEGRVRDRAEWISAEAAAEIIGCAAATVRQHSYAGRIEQRPIMFRRQPSLRRASVEAFAEARARAAAERAVRASKADAEEPVRS